MIRRLAAALAAAALGLAGAPCAAAVLPQLCSRSHEPTAEDQDILLRFSALVKDELAASGRAVAIVARSGLDLSLLDVRYSHAGVVLRDAGVPWTIRQLYFACEERKPRVFDQGMAGFLLGGDDPSTSWVSLVLLPPAQSQALERAALDKAQALRVLGSVYSANAYPFSTRYQNCNQWVAELLATAWNPEPAPDDADARRRAQGWLYEQRYAPTVFEVSPHPMTWIADVVPWLHADDHPPWALAANRFAVSMPLSIETFVHRTVPEAEHVELCRVGRHVVIHRGWDAIPDGCVAGAGDRELQIG